MKKPYIIPIFIPHYGCRHHCVFCNQRKITGMGTTVGPDEIKKILAQHFVNIKRPRMIEVAFYGGSFTAIPTKQQRDLLQPVSQALLNGEIQAVRISTRPDAINVSTLNLLKEYQVSTVELGVQSMDRKVLEAAERGHSVEDVVQAVREIKLAGLNCGIQLMPGLPNEDWQSLILSAYRSVRLGADFARIYPTVVISGTKLADMYSKGIYRPLTLKDAVRRAAFLKLHLQRHGIPVIRTGLQPTEELSAPGVVLDGPYHPAFGEMTDSYLFYVMGVIYFEQRCFNETEVTIHHHRLDNSKVRGQSNSNLAMWLRKYGPVSIRFISDGIRQGELLFTTEKNNYLINTNMIFDL